MGLTGLIKNGGDKFSTIESNIEKNENEIDEVKLKNISPVYAFICILYIFSVMILFVEIVHFNRLNKSKRRRGWN